MRNYIIVFLVALAVFGLAAYDGPPVSDDVDAGTVTTGGAATITLADASGDATISYACSFLNSGTGTDLISLKFNGGADKTYLPAGVGFNTRNSGLIIKSFTHEGETGTAALRWSCVVQAVN